ncbi:hypothetical protein Trydic_g23648 [Trypoxylus dichotomus]
MLMKYNKQVANYYNIKNLSKTDIRGYDLALRLFRTWFFEEMSPANGILPHNDSPYKLVPTVPEDDLRETAEEDDEEERNDVLPTAETEQSDDSSSGDPEIVVPPDGGWGWVVVAASFACNMQSFAASKAHVALIGSLMSGFYLMAGPFASAIANRYGFRIVAISGSILGAFAFVLSYFANSVQFLCISYGLIGGIGFGLIYVPAVITVGFYFERWRALATGIGVCGSGIGTFLFAPLNSYLIAKYSWQNTLLIQAIPVLSCAIFGALFRPLKPTKVKDIKNEKPELVMDSSKLPLETRRKMEKILQQMKGNTIHYSHSTITRIMGANNNCDYPTLADVYHTISVPQHDRMKKHDKRLSIPFMNDEPKIKDGAPLLEKTLIPMIMPRRTSEKRQRANSESSHPRSRKNTISEVNRPLYRDDIFFGASLTRLPQYTSKTSIEYNLAVTRMPTKHDIEEEKKEGCKFCPEAVRRTLATMLDVSLLKTPSFVLLSVSGAFTMMGFYVPFMYLTERAELRGMDVSRSMWLISAIGIANTVGRVICGVLSSLPKVNTLAVNNIALTIGGVATMASGLLPDDWYQFSYAVIFGLAISCFASLRSILVVDLVGLDKLTNAFGLLLLFQGIAAAIGSPVAGAFMEITNSHDASFYLSGSLLLFSAIMCYPLNVINRWEVRRRKEQKPVPV